MTQLITIVAGSWPQNVQADYDLYHAYTTPSPRPYYLVSRFDAVGEWQSAWPRGGLLNTDPAGLIVQGRDYDPFQSPSRWTGSFERKKFTGITRDVTGAALGSCLVQLFRTSDDLLMDQQTSDLLGNYEVYSSDGGQHYIVAYLAGSPDVTGATVNTLTGI